MSVPPNARRNRRSPTTRDIRQALQRTSIELDRALHDADRPEEPEADLRVATYAVHRALVALGPSGRNESWAPPRLVSLTIDETVVALGVIQLLSLHAASDPELRLLADRAMERLRERVASVGDAELELSVLRDA